MNKRRLPHDWFSRELPPNFEMGERSWLYSSFAFQHYRSTAAVGVRIGHDTGIYHGTFFDLGPDAELKVGDYCSLVGVIFSTNGKVTIGDYSLLAHEVVIADHSWSSPHLPASEQSSTGRALTEIGPNVWIGAQAILLGPLNIGEGSIVGAGSVVNQDVPPNSIWAGNPGRIVGRVS